LDSGRAKKGQTQLEKDEFYISKNKILLQTELTGGSMIGFRLLQLVMDESLASSSKKRKSKEKTDDSEQSERKRELIEQIKKAQKQTNDKKLLILQTLGFMKSMDRFSQRAHD
jgi:hypothetical protein